jgi:hypothetical protein
LLVITLGDALGDALGVELGAAFGGVLGVDLGTRCWGLGLARRSNRRRAGSTTRTKGGDCTSRRARVRTS